jgi:hypothetical protein
MRYRAHKALSFSRRGFRVRVLLHAVARIERQRNPGMNRKAVPDFVSLNPGYEVRMTPKSGLPVFGPRSCATKKGERNAGRRIVLMPAHKRRAGRATEKAACAALRLRARSPAGVPLTVFANGTFVPRAQHRARLPERRLKRSGHSRTRRLFGHSDAPRAPVLLPAGMMPEPPGCGVYLSARGCRTRSAISEYPH